MKKYWGVLIVLVLSYWAIAPFLRPGFFSIHDNTQVVRVQQMAQALQAGQFPVRWVADLGYGFGYPIFNFYAPLAYYGGGFLALIGLNVLLATKLMFIIGILLAGVFMYLLAHEFWGEMGGAIAGLFYLYGPYHAVNIYVRGAVGELWAMAFLPLIFYSFYKLITKKSWLWIGVGGLSYAAIVLSHNLTAIMVLPFLFLAGLVALIFCQGRKSLIIRFSLVFVFALGLAAFYWLPAFAEMGLTKVFDQVGGGADWRDHFVFLDQLWASPWGFGGSAPGRLDGMSFMIGKLHLIFTFLGLVIAGWSFRQGKKKEAFVLWLAFIFFVLAVFLTNRTSSLIWELIPYWAFIQYPWRFLTLAILTTSFMAGALAWWFKKNQKLVLLEGGLILLVLIGFSYKYFQPQWPLDVSATDYLSEEKIKWETSKVSDEYLPKDFPIPQSQEGVAWEKIVVLTGEAEVKNLILKPHQYNFDLSAGENTEVLVNTAFFPGWKVWLNGKETEFTLEGGKVKLTPLPGEYRVLVRLTNTPIKKLANLISLISGIGLGALVLKWRYGRA